MSLPGTTLTDLRRWTAALLVRYAGQLRELSLVGPWLGDALPQLSHDALTAWAARARLPSLASTSLDGEIARLTAELDAAAGNRATHLGGLCARFGLDVGARRVWLALATAQRDTALRELLGATTGTRWRPWPQLGRVCELLALTTEDGDAARAALAPGGALRRFRLITPGPEPEGFTDGAEVPFEWQTVLVPGPVAAALFEGRVELGPTLEDVARWRAVERAPRLESLALEPATRDQLAELLGHAEESTHRPLALIGPPGAGTEDLACALGAQLGRGALVVDLGVAAVAPRSLPALTRRALGLTGGALVIVGSPTPNDAEDTLAAALLAQAKEAQAPAFWIGRERPKGLERRNPELEPVVVGFPPAPRRRALWQAALRAEGLAPSAAVDTVAQAFELSAEDIGRISRDVRRRRAGTEPQALGPVTRVEVEDACRDDLELRLGGVTRRVRHATRLEDLVLLDDQRERLEEILRYVRHFDALYTDWGFGKRFLTGRGAHALFTGPPGTGKTMAASALASALDLPLYRIELSQIVDRYVGETEKKLAQVFDEAARAPSVLLFDEADSLFAKRTDVKSANDRYANLETNYLLQRMEEFHGVVVLTTNLESSLDSAAIRRVRFRVAFPEPDAELRERLWRELLPGEADVEEDLELPRLARAFEMSGGHIKNAILRAALHAVHEGRPIAGTDLWRAAVAEYQLLGRLPPSA